MVVHNLEKDQQDLRSFYELLVKSCSKNRSSSVCHWHPCQMATFPFQTVDFCRLRTDTCNGFRNPAFRPTAVRAVVCFLHAAWWDHICRKTQKHTASYSASGTRHSPKMRQQHGTISGTPQKVRHWSPLCPSTISCFLPGSRISSEMVYLGQWRRSTPFGRQLPGGGGNTKRMKRCSIIYIYIYI